MFTDKTKPQGTRYGVIGAGAVGAYLGCRLAVAGHPVDFVARSNYASLSAAALELFEDGRLVAKIDVALHEAIADLSAAEVLIVATKTFDIPDVSEQLVECGLEATIIAFHNGLEPEELYAPELYPILVGGIAYISAVKVASNVVHVIGRSNFLLAPLPQFTGGKRRIETVIEDFRRAGIPVESAGSLKEERWRKTCWSLLFAGPGTILNMDTRQLVSSAAGRELQKLIFDEARLVAAADGVTFSADWLDVIQEAAAKESHLVSMTVDRRSGRRLEEDAIYGAFRRRAGSLRIPTPAIAAVDFLLRSQA